MTGGNGIPFVDLITPHVELQEELLDAVRGVLTTGMFVGGPLVEQFEREFAQFCDVKHCVGVSSGTDALRFALMAAEVGRRDIVITVPNTFVATVEAIVQAGAAPHFVDVDRRTFNMDVDALRYYLETQCHRPAGGGLPIHLGSGKRVKAVIPVHLYGQMCNMDPIIALAEEFGLMVFEDACQAHGSEYFSERKNVWQKAGSVGKAGAFSFYPGKNLGACGEAGAVTTNDESLAGHMRMIRDHGQNKKYHHLVEGYNGRLDALQAALLRVKLPLLNEWNSKRRDAADVYKRLLKDTDVTVPMEPRWSRGNFHLYVIRSRQRDELQQLFTARNIGTGLHYPIPCHLQKGYEYLGYCEGDFPVAEALSREILSLPMFPQIQKQQQERVVETLVEFHAAQAIDAKTR